MFDEAQKELGWWFGERVAALGLHGQAYEAGTARPWDGARNDQAHAERHSYRHRRNLVLERAVGPILAVLGRDAVIVATRAHDALGCSRAVENFFAVREIQAPIVGLAVATLAARGMWANRHAAHPPSPAEAVIIFDALLKNRGASTLVSLRAEAVTVYSAVLERYDALRQERRRRERHAREVELFAVGLGPEPRPR